MQNYPAYKELMLPYLPLTLILPIYFCLQNVACILRPAAYAQMHFRLLFIMEVNTMNHGKIAPMDWKVSFKILNSRIILKAFTNVHVVSDFIWPFLRPYMGVIPNPKMTFIFPISCILALFSQF